MRVGRSKTWIEMPEQAREATGSLEEETGTVRSSLE